MTTNPTIFANAIGAGTGYGDRIAAAALAGSSAEQTVFELMCADVADACDVLAPVYEASHGRDGRVSIEVSSARARHRWHGRSGPRALGKGRPSERDDQVFPQRSRPRGDQRGRHSGISVNVTLIFSWTSYRQVINVPCR